MLIKPLEDMTPDELHDYIAWAIKRRQGLALDFGDKEADARRLTAEAGELREKFSVLGVRANRARQLLAAKARGL